MDCLKQVPQYIGDCICYQNRGLLVPFRETDVGDEAPPFNRPSGSGRWYNLSAVCNEAAAKTKGASP